MTKGAIDLIRAREEERHNKEQEALKKEDQRLEKRGQMLNFTSGLLGSVTGGLTRGLGSNLVDKSFMVEHPEFYIKNSNPKRSDTTGWLSRDAKFRHFGGRK